MKKFLVAVACGLALIGNAQADEVVSKEEVISTVSGTMAALAVAEQAKACFSMSRYILAGYEFSKEKDGELQKFFQGQGADFSDEEKRLVQMGLGMSSAIDDQPQNYYEECLSQAVAKITARSK